MAELKSGNMRYLNFLRFEKVSNIKTSIRLNLLNFETFIEKMTKTLNAWGIALSAQSIFHKIN
ncbi:MAG: hypothetical protein LBF54_00520 [Holosporaceae bacterium]|jgi:hypothetical protein|nr:hypothetical protein [Holosporaceae bacterium]